jgi:hypothetical protein
MTSQRLGLFVFCLLTGWLAGGAVSVAQEEVPLIPRAKFFGNPEKARARLSHDGKRLAFVAPVDGVLNVWVSTDDTPAKAKAITFDKHRGITNYMWAYTNKHILYTQDKNGDEDNHVYAIDLASGKTTDLTPIKKIAAQIEGFSEKFPEEILVGINDRGERHYHDVWRINITTGTKKLVQENPGFAGFLIDDDYRVRLAMNFTPTGGQVYLQPTKDQPTSENDWKPYLEIGVLDGMTTSPAGFNKEATSST